VKGDVLLGPVMALGLNQNTAISKAAMELLQHFASLENANLQREAKHILNTLVEIRNAESERMRDFIQREIARLPTSIQHVVKNSGITLEDIINHFELFRYDFAISLTCTLTCVLCRNCLNFHSKVEFASPSRESTSHSHKNTSGEQSPTSDKKTVDPLEDLVFERLLIKKNPKEDYINWIPVGKGCATIITANHLTVKHTQWLW
jgi:hypothetical protein